MKPSGRQHVPCDVGVQRGSEQGQDYSLLRAIGFTITEILLPRSKHDVIEAVDPVQPQSYVTLLPLSTTRQLASTTRRTRV
jgi:hypothetical protein